MATATAIRLLACPSVRESAAHPADAAQFEALSRFIATRPMTHPNASDPDLSHIGPRDQAEILAQ
ncbi:MAG: hypothetical protein ABI845_03440, partial [Polaromonas sp.]